MTQRHKFVEFQQNVGVFRLILKDFTLVWRNWNTLKYACRVSCICLQNKHPFKLLENKWKGFVEKNTIRAISELFERFWKDSY